MTSSTLPEIANYEVIFSVFDPNLPTCRSERKVTFEIQEASKIQINLIEEPDDCANPYGNFIIQASTALDSIVVSELDFVSGNTLAGTILNFENLRSQTSDIRSFTNDYKITNLLILEEKAPQLA